MGAVEVDAREGPFRNWACAIFVLALAVRSLHLWQLSDAPFFSMRLGDAWSYLEWAERIAGGDWLGDTIFYQTPLYPYFIALVFVLFGTSLLTLKIVQIILGSLSCVFLAAAGRRFFSRPSGIVSGLFLALYAPALFFDALIQKSVLDVFFLTAALWILGEGIAGSRRRYWILLGLTLGCLALTRENALVFVVILALWIPIFFGLRPGVARVALMVAGVAIILLPVAYRNYVVGGEYQLTTSQFGSNFYIGNNPQADGTYVALRHGRGHAKYERNDAVELAELDVGRALTPGEVSRYWLERSLEYIQAEPAHWIRLMATKSLLVWERTEIEDTEDIYTHSDWSLPLRVLGPIFHFGLLLPLALVGALVTFSRWRSLSVLYFMLFGYAASIVLFFLFARHRAWPKRRMTPMPCGGYRYACERLWRRPRVST